MHGTVPTIGHNQPPSPLQAAKEAMSELTAYLKETPTITSFAEQKILGGWIERTRIALNGAREARDIECKPLKDKIDGIRALYDFVREKSGRNEGGMLQRAYDVAKARFTKFNLAEEEKRNAEANRLRLEAEAKEADARAAEAAEQQAIADSEVGECTDVGNAIEQADTAFADFQKAIRQANVAERGVAVRIPSIMGNKSLSLRAIVKPVIEDAELALKTLGLTDKIREAILSSARDYKREFGEWPDGIGQEYERKL